MSLYERLPPDAVGTLVLGIDPGSRLTGFGVVRDTGRARRPPRTNRAKPPA